MVHILKVDKTVVILMFIIRGLLSLTVSLQWKQTWSKFFVTPSKFKIFCENIQKNR